LTLIDGMNFSGDGFTQFLSGPGKQHTYMLHVGAGWAYARLPWMRWRIESVIQKLHPVLRWLVVDGDGFHGGYFHSKQEQRLKKTLARLAEDARHIFYQGLGRSLWFSNGADVQGICRSI